MPYTISWVLASLQRRRWVGIEAGFFERGFHEIGIEEGFFVRGYFVLLYRFRVLSQLP